MNGGRAWWTALVVALACWATDARGADSSVPVQRPRAMTATPMPATPRAATPIDEIDPAPTRAAAPATTPAPAKTTTTSASTKTTATSPAATPPVATQVQDDPTSVPPPVASGNVAPAAAITKSAKPKDKRLRHDGFVTDLRIGTLGCVRGLCGGSHNVSPGFRFDGFLGGNIRGFVDFGVGGGWGTLGSEVAQGSNVLSLYGLDPFLMQQALTLVGGQALGIDLTTLTVNDTKLRAAQVGPQLRVHFIPRGRFAAYVGSGAQYNLFRARYGTNSGDARLDFHGISVPIQAGFGVHVHQHVAVGMQFDYLWTWYALANLDHGGNSLTVPVRILDDAAKMQGGDLRGQLPQFWTLTFGLRARI